MNTQEAFHVLALNHHFQKMMSSILLIFLLTSIYPNIQADSPWHDDHMLPDRSVIVQLFEWSFEDISLECERFLGPNGYGGVQVSPVNEYAVIDPAPWDDNIRRPWYERYQPVSYKIQTRSGNETQLKKMVDKCNKSGVRVYIDVVLNHMTGHFNGTGSAGSQFNGNTFDYPGVPFNMTHFNPKSKCGTKNGDISSDDPVNIPDPYNHPNISRYCELAGLRDLDQFQPYVRQKQVDFLNRLIDMGVAGFRMDASKHMFPQTIQMTLEALHNLPEGTFGPNKKPFAYHETSSLAAPETWGIKSSDYSHVGKPINFRYMHNMRNVIRGDDHQKLANLQFYGETWGFIPSGDAIDIIDNHDLHRSWARPNITQGLSFRDPKLAKIGNAFMLAWPYGQPKIMSSYGWPQRFVGGEDKNTWMGPPHDKNYNIKKVIINFDGTCGNSWICEHRYVIF